MSERPAAKIVKIAKMRSMLALALSVLAIGCAQIAPEPPPAASVRPLVTVTDGDTLRLDGAPVRLWGVDAPELRQTCASAPGSPPAPAGMLARAHLAEIVATGGVACESRGRDRYGRTVASCTVAGADIASRMVADGWALDWPRYSRGEFSNLEVLARRDRRGVWGFDCVAPWDFRHSRHGG